MSEPYQWSGILRPGPQPNTIVLELRDNLDFYPITVTGTKVDGGYACIGIPGPIPDGLKIPLVDDGV